MGGLFESKQKTSSTQSTQVPLNFSQLMDRTISFANEGLDTPFQAYNAPRIAELSANEQAGISAAGSQAGMYQPLIDMAMTNNADMQSRGGIPTSGDLNQFINPYVDYVLGNSLDRLQEQSDTNMTKIGSTAAMSGAFGGTRHGVLEGANLAELLKSSRDLSASTYSDAFDKGMGNWFRSQDLRRGTIRDALDITGQGSTYNRGDINTLMQTGLTGRTRDQSVLDFAFSEFMREQQDPFTKAGFASSILSSYPTNLFTRNSQSETTNTPSPFSQIAGIGMAAAGLMTGNPAAAAGLMSGQQSLGTGAPIGGIEMTGPGGMSGAQLGALTPDQFMDMVRGGGRMAKGGKVKGYKKGGKVQGGISLLDEGVLERIAKLEENANSYELPDTLEWLKPFVETPTIFGPETKEEKRARKFTDKTGKELDRRALTRLILDDKIRNTQYLDDPLNSAVLNLAKSTQDEELKQEIEWNQKWAPYTHQELSDMAMPTDSLDDYFTPEEHRRRTHKVQGYPSTKKFGNGGFIDSLFGGMGFGVFNNQKTSPNGPQTQPPATMVEALSMGNQPQQQRSSNGGTFFGGSILDAVMGTGRYANNESGWNRNNRPQTPAPYTPRPQTPYDWNGFYERQGLNRIPTAQSNINPNYANSRGPDLSMFMEMLQQRIGGQNQGGPLPTPPFQTQGFSKGGKVKRFAEGGKTYLKIKPSTQQMAKFIRDQGFTNPDEMAGDTDVPASYFLDPERVFALALQKHESGASEFDNPNYQARPIDKKTGKQLSSAMGIGQWILPTWNTLAQKSEGEIPSWTQELLDKGKLPDKATQDKAWKVWNNLLKNNYGDDLVSRFAAHQLGDNDFNKLRKAPRGALVRDVVGDTIARNVSAKNKTVAQYFKSLEEHLDKAEAWEKQRLAKKGYNLTDIVRGEGGDPNYDFNAPKKQYVKQGRMNLDDILITPDEEQGYATRQKDIESQMNKDAYAKWRRDLEDAQINRPNNENVLTPTTYDGRVSRKHKGAVDPLELFSDDNAKFGQYMNLTRFKDLPTRHRNPKFGEYLTPEEEEAINRKLGGGYKAGGYVKKFARGGSPDEEETLAQKRYRDAVNAARRGVGQEDLPSGYWGDPLSSVADQLGTQGVNELDHIWGSDTTPYTAKSILGKFGDLGGRSLASIIPGLKLAGSTIPNTLSTLFENDGSMGKTPTPSPSKSPSPFGDLNMNLFTPDNEGTSAEEFNSALESGEPSEIVSGPAQTQLQEDSLTTALKAMIMQEIEDRKGRKEPGPPTLFGREINMPLLKMGLGILANSGYPNSAGEAIGKGVLGALNQEEQAQLDKSKRNNDKLKELLNLRYMQGMVESMDPNIKMQLQRERAAQEMTQKAYESEVDYQNRMRLFREQFPMQQEGRKDLEKYKADLAMQSIMGGQQEDEGINVD